MPQLDPELVAATLSAVSTIIAAVAVLIAYGQVREAARSYRATLLSQLIQEWNSPKTYSAIVYIHELRRQWKTRQPDPKQWGPLAYEWVQANAPSGIRAGTKEWNKRRYAAQFISKMGYLMDQRYLSPDDFFGVVAEAPRLLLVLDPIERCIVSHYDQLEEPGDDEWDHPLMKVAFDRVAVEYKKWFQETGRHLIAPNQPAVNPTVKASTSRAVSND